MMSIWALMFTSISREINIDKCGRNEKDWERLTLLSMKIQKLGIHPFWWRHHTPLYIWTISSVSIHPLKGVSALSTVALVLTQLVGNHQSCLSVSFCRWGRHQVKWAASGHLWGRHCCWLAFWLFLIVHLILVLGTQPSSGNKVMRHSPWEVKVYLGKQRGFYFTLTLIISRTYSLPFD